MKIENGNVNIKKLFDLKVGDIFLCDDCYYIAGRINMCDLTRTCYNLLYDNTETFHNNIKVTYWEKDNVSLVLNNN